MNNQSNVLSLHCNTKKYNCKYNNNYIIKQQNNKKRKDTNKMKKKDKFKTEFQEKKEKQDLAIYNEFNSLASEKGSKKTAITKFLMKKYDIHSENTIYKIRRDVGKLLNEQNIRL